jgi:hypothetical protein
MTTTGITNQELSVQAYRFRYRVLPGGSPVVLNRHKGSALRGALFNSLRQVGCSRRDLPTCHNCPLVKVCPVSSLLATVDDESERGADVPRPFAIQPPLDDKNVYQPDDDLEFGLTLFGKSDALLPYLLVALERLDKSGLGARSEPENKSGSWQRGRLRLEEVAARHPLTGREELLYTNGAYRDVTLEPLDAAWVLREIAGVPADAACLLRFNFETPTRLVADGKMLHRPNLSVLVQRLIERYESYAGSFTPSERAELLAVAQNGRLIEDRTQWEEVRGYSHRQKQEVRLSGFTGEAVYAGQLRMLLPLLIWGQALHVGKSATKGCGRYRLRFFY